MLTLEEVKKKIKQIKKMEDDEAAHGAEDELHIEVLKAIAQGAYKPEKLAREALKTLRIDFNRWCA